MALQILAPPPTDAEREAVDAVLGPALWGWHGADRDVAADTRVAYGARALGLRRDLLLPALHALQARVGWISETGLGYVCRRLDIPPAEAYGVASFYHLFSLGPQPPKVVHVCDDVACRARGAERLCADLARSFGPEGTVQ